jgi:cytochrome c biogenesis protein ResB
VVPFQGQLRMGEQWSYCDRNFDGGIIAATKGLTDRWTYVAGKYHNAKKG